MQTADVKVDAPATAGTGTVPPAPVPNVSAGFVLPPV